MLLRRMPEPPHQPILRWLGSWSPYHQPGSPKSSPDSRSPSRSSFSSTPPSPSLASLNEALHESLLPTKPPLARLPPSFYSSKSLSHAPPFLDNLTRSTLPTSSLSPPLPTGFPTQYSSPPSTSDLQSPPIVLTHSSLSRTSLDTLRSVSYRDHVRSSSLSSIGSTSTATALPSEPPTSNTTSWWWFQSDNKANVDSLLGDDDRAETVQEEQEHIRNKCTLLNSSIIFSALNCISRPLCQKSCRVLSWPSGIRFRYHRSCHRTSSSHSLAWYQGGLGG